MKSYEELTIAVSTATAEGLVGAMRSITSGELHALSTEQYNTLYEYGVKKNPMVLQYVSGLMLPKFDSSDGAAGLAAYEHLQREFYGRLCSEALVRNVGAFNYINPEALTHDQYFELSKRAMELHSFSFEMISAYSSCPLTNGQYVELCMKALEATPFLLDNVQTAWLTKDQYFSLCVVAVKKKPDILRYVKAEALPSTSEEDSRFNLCLEYVKASGDLYDITTSTFPWKFSQEQYLELFRAALVVNPEESTIPGYNWRELSGPHLQQLRLFYLDKGMYRFDLAHSIKTRVPQGSPSEESRLYYEFCVRALERKSDLFPSVRRYGLSDEHYYTLYGGYITKHTADYERDITSRLSTNISEVVKEFILIAKYSPSCLERLTPETLKAITTAKLTTAVSTATAESIAEVMRSITSDGLHALTTEQYNTLYEDGVKKNPMVLQYVSGLMLPKSDSSDGAAGLAAYEHLQREFYGRLCSEALARNVEAFNYINPEALTHDQYFELCKRAMELHSFSFKMISDYSSCPLTNEQYVELCMKALEATPFLLDNVQTAWLTKAQYFSLCVVAVKKKPDVLGYVKVEALPSTSEEDSRFNLCLEYVKASGDLYYITMPTFPWKFSQEQYLKLFRAALVVNPEESTIPGYNWRELSGPYLQQLRLFYLDKGMYRFDLAHSIKTSVPQGSPSEESRLYYEFCVRVLEGKSDLFPSVRRYGLSDEQYYTLYGGYITKHTADYERDITSRLSTSPCQVILEFTVIAKYSPSCLERLTPEILEAIGSKSSGLGYGKELTDIIARLLVRDDAPASRPVSEAKVVPPAREVAPVSQPRPAAPPAHEVAPVPQPKPAAPLGSAAPRDRKMASSSSVTEQRTKFNNALATLKQRIDALRVKNQDTPTMARADQLYQRLESLGNEHFSSEKPISSLKNQCTTAINEALAEPLFRDTCWDSFLKIVTQFLNLLGWSRPVSPKQAQRDNLTFFKGTINSINDESPPPAENAPSPTKTGGEGK